ncbi:hypothetical protein DMH26_43440, partial [Streptomyces sp. WAC 05379]
MAGTAISDQASRELSVQRKWFPQQGTRRSPPSGRRPRERRTSVVRPAHRTALGPSVGPLPAAVRPTLAAPVRRRRYAGARRGLRGWAGRRLGGAR